MSQPVCSFTLQMGRLRPQLPSAGQTWERGQLAAARGLCLWLCHMAQIPLTLRCQMPRDRPALTEAPLALALAASLGWIHSRDHNPLRNREGQWPWPRNRN